MPPEVPAEPASRPDYLRAALTPRMLALLVALLAAAAVCGLLGAWQLDRARERGEAAAAQQAAEEAADAAGAAPVPLAQALAPQTSLGGDLLSLRVTATGEFRGEEVLVADRVVDGRLGLLVVTPLWVPIDGGEAVIAVVRGWVPDAASAARYPAPEGEVTVVGHLRGSEATGRDTMPEGQVDAIAAGELVNRWGGPIWSAYLLAAEIDPPSPGLVIAPLPEPETGLNIQNLAYALQWWIFGGFALAVWIRLVRDEARAALPEPTEATPPLP